MAQVLDLFVQRTYGVMSNDVLIAIPLFVFMGYLVERAALIDKLFRSLHLATARVPGSLAVATIVTCAIFATATGIVGAVVTLMGLLAFPAMLKAGYNVKVSAGCVTAGGCLGILIPPSVLLIVYGATAGVSVVQLYAGAFFPGLMLAGLYIGYVIVLAKLKPDLMPPLTAEERAVPLPSYRRAADAAGQARARRTVSPGAGRRGRARAHGARAASRDPAAGHRDRRIARHDPPHCNHAGERSGHGGARNQYLRRRQGGRRDRPCRAARERHRTGRAARDGTGLAAPPETATGLSVPSEPSTGQALAQPPNSATLAQAPAAAAEPGAQDAKGDAVAPGADATRADRLPTPNWFWVMAAICAAILIVVYFMWTWERLQVFKMLLASFFPLALLILAVLGSIVFGFATPTEAAAVGAFGGFLLAAAYRFVERWRTTPAGQPEIERNRDERERARRRS